MGAPGALLDAIRTLRTEPLRTLLTMFGVVWGTSSVVFLLSWGLGIVRMIDDGINRIGRNAAFAEAGQIGEQFTPATDRRQLWFTLDDLDAVRRRARIPELITGESQAWRNAAWGQKTLRMDVRGVEPEMLAMRSVSLAAGRNLTRDDLDQRRRVALIGVTARSRLLGPAPALGAHIRIDGQSFEVVGLLARVGTQLSRDSSEIDEQTWIPLTAFWAFGPRPDAPQDAVAEDTVDVISMRVPHRDRYPAARDELRAILAERLGVSVDDDEAIEVGTSMEALDQIPIKESGVVLFVLAFGTLAIGGVGILAMMLDAVQERRSEIGVRLAVGARPRDVLAQFFLETFTITALGGAVGLALGVGGSAVLGSFQAPDLIPLPILRPWIVWLAVGTMIVVGVGSGVIPAWRAARVDPAETLRFE